jgi:DNA polymerase III sliding clamp (beta) subunit (PCNA family)
MNDPFVLLPANLASLAAITAEAEEAQRYSMTGVLVRLNGDSYEAVATDGRRLALVRGTATANPLEYPTVPELAKVPPSAAQAVIPTRAWRDAFRAVPRGRALTDPILGHVAVHLGEKESILATTDGEAVRAETIPNVEGRFPDYEAVLPCDEPRARVELNPELLLDLVRLVRDFVANMEARRITLEVHDPGTPIVIKATNGTQELVGLLMPLT